MYHHLEEAAKVYLSWNDDENAWELSPANMDGHPLDSAYGGLRDWICPCRETTDTGATTAEHDEVWNRAAVADLPSADDLYFMLRRESSTNDAGVLSGTGETVVPGEMISAVDFLGVALLLHDAFTEGMTKTFSGLAETVAANPGKTVGFNHLHVTVMIKGDPIVEDAEAGQ